MRCSQGKTRTASLQDKSRVVWKEGWMGLALSGVDFLRNQKGVRQGTRASVSGMEVGSLPRRCGIAGPQRPRPERELGRQGNPRGRKAHGSLGQAHCMTEIHSLKTSVVGFCACCFYLRGTRGGVKGHTQSCSGIIFGSALRNHS